MAKPLYKTKPNPWKVFMAVAFFVMTKVAIFMGIRRWSKKLRAEQTTA